MNQKNFSQDKKKSPTLCVDTAEGFARAMPVSRETLDAFEVWRSCLADWNQRMNLVSASSLETFWGRHALDCAQLWRFIPHQARSLADFGSGAGFPGLALALMAREDRRDFSFSLIESQRKKAGFLRHMVQRLKLDVNVLQGRLEDQPRRTYDVITARALAPMGKLLGYAHLFWGPQTLGLFLKGRRVDEDMKNASLSWSFREHQTPSLSDPEGRIIQITDLRTQKTFQDHRERG